MKVMAFLVLLMMVAVTLYAGTELTQNLGALKDILDWRYWLDVSVGLNFI